MKERVKTASRLRVGTQKVCLTTRGWYQGSSIGLGPKSAEAIPPGSVLGRTFRPAWRRTSCDGWVRCKSRHIGQNRPHGASAFEHDDLKKALGN